jgi:hypothetical protein
MKFRIPFLVFVLLLPAVSFSQDLYFTILDSLDYNPTSLDVADFDGDGLDEIFAGSDTGLLVINPRTHRIMYYSDILRERVTASALFDVDGDGAKDILVGTATGGNWLYVIWGAGYGNYYRWGGYAVARISGIFNGIRPDTANIIMACGDRGEWLYNIDPYTWNYSAFLSVASSHPGNLAFIPGTNINAEIDPYGQIIIWAEIHGFTSDFSDLIDYSLCENFWIETVIPFGVASGQFLDGINIAMLAPLFCSSAGMRIFCFDHNGNFINTFSDSTLANLQGGRNPVAGDFNTDTIDDLLIPLTIAGQAMTRAYNGSDLSFMGIVDNLPYTEINVSGKFFDDSKALLYISNHRIYIGDISTATGVYTEGKPIVSATDIFIYPNPFNEVARINFTINRTEKVNVIAVNLLGQIVDDMFSGCLSPGAYCFSWKPSGLSSGIYFICVATDKMIMPCKVELLK